MERVQVKVRPFSDRKALQLQWLDPLTGRRRTQSAETADPSVAERKRADLEYELNNGIYQEASRIGWECFREVFEQEYLSGVRENTRRGYKTTFDSFERFSRPTSLRAITARTLSRFVATLRSLPEPGRAGILSLKPSTIAVHLEHLRAALRWAAKQEMIQKVPEMPPLSVPRKRPRPVPVEHYERLLAVTDDPQLRAFMACAWLAGLRRTEAFTLEWAPTEQAPYLDLDVNRIIFPAEAVKAAEDQWVPLDPTLRRILEALAKERARVFRFLRNGKEINHSTAGKRVRELAEAAGVPLTMRVLRRGFGCRYAARVPAQVLQRLMRHSSIAITMTYYANVDDAVEEAVLQQ